VCADEGESSLQTAHILLGAIVIVSIVLMLIRPRDIAEVYWIGAGVALLLIFRLMTLSLAGRAAAKGLDVYLFLIGMMLLSELAREHGVFDWVSSAAVRHAKGSYARLFLLVYCVGTVVTIFMSNDATAVVLTPAVLAAVRRARVGPLPYVFVCAFVANAASFVLPISNPANLVVFHKGMPVLGRWLLWFGVPSAISVVATYLVLRWIFRGELRGAIEVEAGDHFLTHDGKLVIGGLAATVVVLLIASGLDWDLGLPTCVTALAVTAIVSLRARANPVPLFREISWSTLVLVAGLFVMVDAVESIGAMRYTQEWLAWIEALPRAAGVMLTGFVVGVGNNLVNNLPLGLIAGGTLQSVHASAPISSAVLIGVDLGPNLSITGSLATILWLIALRKEKLNVSFWGFLRIGAIAMPVALLFSLGGALAMQAAFAIR
jgi:arsenical pump membrane protein